MSDMREVDGRKMRKMENLARQIGRLIGGAINQVGERHGFILFVFSFDGPEITYISNAEREGALATLKEFIARQEAGEADQLWHERN